MVINDLMDLIISTHSLTRRLTVTVNQTIVYVSYFNSQPHKEADLISSTHGSQN